ncbi:MAG: phosphoribosylformylglycinamidine synthase subunit PurL [Janthinobacterium lividum]
MIDPTIYREMGLNDSEYALILEALGREPSITELGMYAVMWSEHCGYKYSRPVLRLFKKYKEAMDTGAVENAGVIDIGNNIGVVMKMESHNHPSAVEPFQGAATGVGGILRDIFTMGARPIAILNSLRFGPIEGAENAHTRYLFEHVVGGISHYGNCLASDETLVWRDSSGVHFDTIGSFVEAHLLEGQDTAELTALVETLSLDPDALKSCWRPIRRVFRRQTQSLVRLRTAMGRSLTVTPDHPMLTLKEGAWQIRYAQALQAGDQVPLLLDLPASSDSDILIPKPLDLIEVLVAHPEMTADVFVRLPSEWKVTDTARSALRVLEPSIMRRHQYLKSGRFPFQHFLQMEAALDVPREELRLFRRSGKANYMKAVIQPDADLARMIGYYLAEGCISANGNTQKIIWTFALHETEYVQEVAAALQSLGLHPCVEIRSSTIAVYATSWLLGHVLKEVWKCGAGSADKAIPACVFEWPHHLRREVLKGILRGDGSLTTKTHGNHAKVSFASTSRRLFDQTLALIQHEGAVPALHNRPEQDGFILGRQHKSKLSYHLEVCNRAGLIALADMFGSERTATFAGALARYDGNGGKWSFPRFQMADGLAAVKIKSVEILETNECNVYDIEVDGTHLFATTSGIVTHNCVGVPTVGGEIYFHPSYAGNPLVNAMAVGVVPLDKIASAESKGIGNPVLYVGSATGKDGIHGATFASVELGPDSESKRPNVQMGDPFAEKLLIEATLEALATGYVVGIQDMGAAGLTCSTCEMSAKGSVGMDVDVRLVPQREAGMTPYEIMLSESQERMLAVIEKGREDEVAGVFHKWGLNAVVIGTVTDTGRVVLKDQGVVVADVPAKSLTDDCPTYSLAASEPAYIKEVQSADLSNLPEPTDYNAVLLKLLASPSIASKRWVYDQYDSMVQTQTTVLPGAADAAVLRLRESGNKGLALTTDCNPRYCYLDPYLGAQIAVAEAARNLSCVGATPLAVTDCLNFASPEKPEGFWQFERAVAGLADACEAFGTPVISGNVSFYNETPEGAIFPTPTVGMVGLLPDADKRVTMSFKNEGDFLYLIGGGTPAFGGSEYLAVIHGKEVGSPPALDTDAEKKLQAFLREAISQGSVQSAHDVSDGGLAVALAECCITGSLGAYVPLQPFSALTLYGECMASVVVSVSPDKDETLRTLLEAHDVSCLHLGEVVPGNLTIFSDAIDVEINLPVSDLRTAYEGAIPAAMK